MDVEDVDFLRCYLDEQPAFKERVLLDPPRLFHRGRWRRIRQIRTTVSGVVVSLTAGERVLLEKSTRRDSRLPLLLLREHFPGFLPIGVLLATDRVRRQSGAFARLLVSNGSTTTAVIFVHPSEPAHQQSRVLGALLLWWDDFRRRGQPVERAWIWIPACWGSRLVALLPVLKMRVQCFVYTVPSNPGRRMQQVYPRPPHATRIAPPYVLYPCSPGPSAELQKVADSHPELAVSFRGGRWEAAYRGLALLWEDDGRVWFDPLSPRELSDAHPAACEQLLTEVRQLRRFPPATPDHPFYTLQPERWLESLLIADRMKIDARLGSHLYSQVPTCVDGQRKVMDLVGATLTGQLVVVELKAVRDLGLIFQALEYWDRVRTHLRRGDFCRQGYFQGVRLQPKNPLLYLVCPLFEYDRAMPIFRRYLKRGVRFQCLGVNSDWKRGLRIIRRFQF